MLILYLVIALTLIGKNVTLQATVVLLTRFISLISLNYLNLCTVR
uniref:Uncharacterized protein n=1 Tax=Arundo donax TaxID=35708 RepID=A0A0A9GQN7_ARUDO